MQDFLHNIFSRGSQARTDSPVVSVGGVSSNSGTLTYDVLHFDTTGALIVTGGGGASGTATSNVVASQSGSWTVAVSGGTMSVLWAQRLDATNDAITVYQNASNSNWTVIASQSGSWTVAGVISAGTVTAIVSAGTVTAVVAAGTVTAVALLSGTMTVSSVLSGTMSSITLGQARTTDPAAAANAAYTPIITDSLGKQVVLPGAVNDLHLNGQAQIAQIAAAALIATPGAGRRIALQSLLVTGSGSQVVQVVITGGPSARTFGFVTPTGGFALNAGGAPLYITSASTNLSVNGDVTSTFNVFASGYSLSN